MRVYKVIWDPTDAVPTSSSELIPVFDGVVTRNPYNEGIWRISAESFAIKDLQEIPLERVNPADHPYAGDSWMGKVWPVILGEAPVRVPLVNINQYTNEFQWDPHASAPGEGGLWVGYPSTSKLALILSPSFSNGKIALGDNLDRRIEFEPIAPMDTNDVSDWWKATNGEWVEVATNDNLDLFFDAVPNLGDATAATFQIFGYGSPTYNWTLKQNGTTVDSQTGVTGNTTLRDVFSGCDFSAGWSVFTLEIDVTTGGSGKYITDIQFKVEFTDPNNPVEAAQQTVYGSASGRAGSANLRDGSSISNTTNPVNVVQYLLRAKDLGNLLVARIDTTVFSSELGKYGSTPDYEVDDLDFHTSIGLTETADLGSFLNEFAFANALHIWPGYDSKWKLRVRDKDRDPEHYIGPEDIALRNYDPVTGEPTGNWEADADVSFRPITEIITDVFVRYAYDHHQQNYTKAFQLSARHKITGNGDLTWSNPYQVEDTSATFITDGVQVDWNVTFENGRTAQVAAVTSETILSLKNIGFPIPADETGLDYWVGPGTSYLMVKSAERYGVDRSLGQTGASTIFKLGGYTLPFMAGDSQSVAAAKSFAYYVQKFMSQAWCRLNLALFQEFSVIEPGDVVVCGYDNLPARQRRTSGGTLDGAHNSSVTTLTLHTGEGNNYAADDLIVVGREVMKVGTPSADSITVTRARANTDAAAHADGDTVYKLPVRFEVQSYREEPFTGKLRIGLQELPKMGLQP